VITCKSIYSAQQSFSADIPCAAVKDWVVPFCPVEVSGFARIKIGSALKVTRLELHYICDPPGPKEPGDIPPIQNASPIQTDSTWLDEQRIDLKTDRDDMIFTIPVPIDSIVAEVRYDGSPLSRGDSVVVGRSYTIDWSALDVALQQCCGGTEDVRLVYRSAEDGQGHPDDACYVELEASASSGAGTYAWSPSTISCATSGQKFIVFLEFICNTTGEILYRTRTDWYKYYQ